MTSGESATDAQAASGPDLTIAVCTRNNARQLAGLLASIEKLAVPPGTTWELVVVNNGSSDHTAEVLAGWLGRLPMRTVEEPIAGLGRARNRAIDAARGALVCWTDDDVEVPPDWLTVYWEAARRHHSATFFGGRIEPKAEPSDNGWFAPRMRHWPISSVVAYRDLGEREMRLSTRADNSLWGANYAVRAAALRAYRFDDQVSFGEETDILDRMLADGEHGWWLPASHVSHIVRPERQTRDYLTRYYLRIGWTLAFYTERDRRARDRSIRRGRWLRTNSLLLRSMLLRHRLIGAVARKSANLDGELSALASEHYLRGVLDFRQGLEPWNSSNPVQSK